MEQKDILIYDLECKVFGKPDSSKDEFRIFACYSYETKKYYTLTEKEDIQKIINKHKFLIGFNNIEYDNPILKRFGINIDYKIIIDLMVIIDKRKSGMKIKEGMLGDLLIYQSLDFITKLLGLADEETGKKKIDYKLFYKDKWSNKEYELIADYAKRDIEITKKLYEWLESYFVGFKSFVTKENIRKKKYLTSSLAGFAYEAICNAMKWEPVKSQTTEKVKLKGGYVSYPAGEKFEGDIFCLDFNCLIEGTQIKMCGKYKNQYYNKNIEDLQEGEFIVNHEGKQMIDNIKKEYYEGDVIEIELENNKKICCTPQHQFPVYRDEKQIDIKAEDLKFSDELICRKSKRGIKNGHYRGGKIEKKCEVCNKNFLIFPSEDYIKSCSIKCSNILKSRNSAKTNLGKRKEDTPHLMKMSLERTGVKRNLLSRKNIAIGNKKSNQNNYNNGKYQYKDIVFKSEYELKVAQALDRDNIKWMYEPKVFVLNDKDVYTPDFYLPDLDKWLEVKGTRKFNWTEGHKKFKAFNKKYKNSVIIFDDQIKELKEMLEK